LRPGGYVLRLSDCRLFSSPPYNAVIYHCYILSREAGSVKREITHRSISETLEIKQGEAAFIHFLTFLFFFKLIADTVDAFYIVRQIRGNPQFSP